MGAGGTLAPSHRGGGAACRNTSSTAASASPGSLLHARVSGGVRLLAARTGCLATASRANVTSGAVPCRCRAAATLMAAGESDA
jgi:hypothetical protein